VRKFLGIMVKTMKVTFIVFCVYLGSLFFRQETVPQCVCVYLCEKLSNSETVVNFESMSFGFRHGFRLERLRVFGLTRKDPLEPVVSADVVSIWPLTREVKIVGLKFPRLHDGYYEVGTRSEPLGENNGRFSFPQLPNFDLELVRPEILGIAPDVVTAKVSVDPLCLDFHGIHLIWPDADERMTIDGTCVIDLGAMRVFGQIEGLTKQSHIRPLLGDYHKLVTLDVPVALPYFDAFTEVPSPVPASCAWDVNLVNNEFTVRVRLKPEMGRYNGVSLKEATGGVTVHVWWVDGLMQYETRVDVDSSCDRFGRTFGGHLSVFGTNDVRVVAVDAQSGLKKQDTLDIIGYLNNGLLDCFECVTPPQVSVRGVLATFDHQQNLNDLHGRITCESAKFFGIAVSNVTTRFDYVGDTITFSDAQLIGRTGGKVGCRAAFSFPGYDDAKARYDVDLDYRDGSVEELSDVFKFDLGKRHGKVNGQLHLSSMMFTNSVSKLNGRGHVKVRDGHIAQMKLFMGLTELLADKVPGVAGIVNQSDASADFTITNGVMESRNVRIEGALFSISGEGRYDINKDDLDFVVQVRFMKDDAAPGLKELVRVLSWPFSKLLMEIKLTGSLDNPQWKYISLLDRVL